MSDGQAADLRLRLHASRRFQGLFHSPRRGAFHRSLTVLCAIGRCVYVALGSGLPGFTPDCSCPVLLKHSSWRSPVVSYAAITRSGDAFQTSSDNRLTTSAARQYGLNWLPTPTVQGLPAWHTVGLGISRFARHYYGNDFCSSGYMRCFSSPGALRGITVTSRSWLGCPIRRSWDRCLLAAPPRLSQLCHVLRRHAAPRHPPYAHSVFPEERPCVNARRND